MGLAYDTPVVSIIVDPAGTPETITARLLHFTQQIGGRPSEFVFQLANKRPKDVSNASYRGKTCQIKVNGTAKMTGTIQRIEKEWSRQTVVFTVLDDRHLINATYVGASLLETLDGNGLPTTTNGLPFYGADVVFNLNGLPNKDKSSLAFKPPGYEHNTTGRDYWRYITALEWLWTNCITAVSYPLQVSQVHTVTQAGSAGGGSGSYSVTVANGTPWMAYSTDPWLTTSTTGTGTGSGQTVNFVKAANASADARTGYIWVIPAFAGLDKKMDELGPLIGTPVAEALDALVGRTRAHWWIAGGTGYVAAIDLPTSTLPLVIPDPDAPIAPDGTATDRPIDLHVEESTDDVVTQMDVIGGKQQREILTTSSDWTQTQWYGITINDGWAWDRVPLFNFNSIWSNYDTENYRSIVISGQGWISGWPKSHIYRYNIKPDIFATHKIGPNIATDDQPYRALPSLLLARDKNGNFINPDSELAYDAVSPLELLFQQYPDGATLDLDRGYLFARGYPGPWVLTGTEIIKPPIYSGANPQNLTLAFECAHRAWKSASTSISGVPDIRRAVIRDELIHKTREATKVVMPINASFDNVSFFDITEGRTVPTGATKDYSTPTSIPLNPMDYTITLPSGIVVDGMAELNEIKNLVSPYVGLLNINGTGAFPTWVDLPLGTKLSDASGQYGLTGNEVVTAVTFDGETQRLEFQFTNRLGRDAAAIANAFVDQRQYRRPV